MNQVCIICNLTIATNPIYKNELFKGSSDLKGNFYF